MMRAALQARRSSRDPRGLAFTTAPDRLQFALLMATHPAELATLDRPEPKRAR